MKLKSCFLVLIGILIMSGCATTPTAHDYSSFRNADPKSILILPPINETTEVIAPYAVMTQMVTPVAESGFYVYPVALVDQTFKNNGLTVANDVHAVPVGKLHEIFGADTALYTTIREYGTSYVVISSETAVTLNAKLVDLRTGDVLWQDSARASSAQGRGNSGGGLLGMLIEAAVAQVFETVTDAGYDIAAMSATQLLHSDGHNGLLHGPRSKKYGQPATSEKSK